MKRSTVFLAILGISVLLIGEGFVLAFPSQTFFSDSYTANQYPEWVLFRDTPLVTISSCIYLQGMSRYSLFDILLPRSTTLEGFLPPTVP